MIYFWWLAFRLTFVGIKPQSHLVNQAMIRSALCAFLSIWCMFCWRVMTESIWYQVDVLDDTTYFWTYWTAVKSVRWLGDWTQGTGKEKANHQVEKRYLSCGNSENAQKWAFTINNHKNKLHLNRDSYCYFSL